MGLYLIVDTGVGIVSWVGASFATRLGLDDAAITGRSLGDVLLDVAGQSAFLVAGDNPVDRYFDDVHVTVSDGVGGRSIELDLVSVCYIHEGRKALLSLSVPHGDAISAHPDTFTEAETRYNALVRDSNNGVVLHDGTRVISANMAARSMVAWSAETPVKGVPIAMFVDAGDREALDDARRRLSDQPGESQQVMLRLRRVDGDTVRVNAVIAAAEWDGHAAIQLVMHEVTTGRFPVSAGGGRRLHSTGVARVVTDGRLRIVEWDDSATELYGWSAAEVRGRRISDVVGSPHPRWAVPDEVIAAAVLAGADSAEVAAMHLCRDGSRVAVRATTTVQFATSGTVAGLLIEARPLHAPPASSPSVSGRLALLASLESPQCAPLSVVVLFDVDHFHLINERHGPAAGDAVLAAMWECVAGQLGVDDLVVRLDGDRFGVRCCADTIEEAQEIALRLEDAMTARGELGGLSLSLSFSVGAAWGPSDPCLFEHAATGLRSARRQGGHQLCWFDSERRPSDWLDEASFAAEMRAAMAYGAIHVAYQPIVDLTSGRVLKVEALARWDHPVRGAVPPGVFIPVAERHGLIDELGAWVLQTSCAAVVEMNRAGIGVDLTVNLSPMQLRHPDVAKCVANALDAAGLDANRLWIEVTESVLVDDQSIGPLHELQDLGVRIVIDDFGTGYNSFQYLTRLHIDALKIDVSFVNGLGVDVNDSAIVRSVIGLGRELGMQVVAEGVETESQRAQLLALNCRLGQGWLFGRAVRLDEFVQTHGQPLLQHTDESSDATNESLRLAALEACRVLDTDHETAFDSLAQLAARLMNTPMALISLIDADRQWFKARVGVDLTETSRDIAFCSHAITRPEEAFVVQDAALDERFATNPLVTGIPNIRAYAGIPICSREGLALGTLCVLDTAPRSFSTDELALLTTLADQVATLLDLRRRAAELHELIQRLQNQHLEIAGAPDLVPVDVPTVPGGS